MPQFVLTSSDTLTLYGRVFNDFADNDVTQITFPNELVTLKTGKNKNTIFAKDEKGHNADLSLRLLRGSSDDQFLQEKLAAQNADFVTAQLAEGRFVKRLGDGEEVPTVINDAYTLRGGMITKFIDGKENAEGDTEQAVSIYTFKFAQAGRSIE